MKPDENLHIYDVFSTYDHQISMGFPNRSVLKNNLKTDAGICVPQISEKWANYLKICSKEGRKIHQQSMKIHPGSLCVLFADAGNPYIIKMVTWGANNEPPGEKIF